MVGLLLPPSVPGALVNFAALLAGQSAGQFELHRVRRDAGLVHRAVRHQNRHHLKAFLEKVKLKVPCETIFLEELAAKPGFGEKFAAFFMALIFCPSELLERALGVRKEVDAG